MIGYGHEIAADETFDTPITLMQAEALLLADLHLCEALLYEKKPQIKDRFQQETLIAWIFSVGITRFNMTEIWP